MYAKIALLCFVASIACATAHEEKNEKEKQLNYLFDIIDADNSGKITVHELKAFFKKVGLNKKQIEELFKKADINGDKEIDKAEFDKSFKDIKIASKEDILKATFDAIDSDNSGHIDLPEAIKFYERLGLKKEEIEEDFKKMDKDGSGKVSFKEFEESANEA